MGQLSQLDIDQRVTWPHRRHFLLTCVGFSVGFGNLWRFPSLVIAHDGVVFFVPYIVLLVLIGLPMCYLEMALGQFSSRGPLEVFASLAPVCTGIGVAMSLCSLVVCLYYNTFIAYSLYYIQQSLTYSKLPWSSCDSSWGADKYCYTRLDPEKTLPLCHELVHYASINQSELIEFVNCTKRPMELSGKQYFEKNLLRVQLKDTENVGSINRHLAICLFLAWFLVFFCVFKGIKSSGKVVHFTTTFPFLVIVLILIVGFSTEPGAYQGFVFLFKSRWDILFNLHMWHAAVSQVFYSMSISYGPFIMYSSFNKFHAGILSNAIFVTTVDFLSSVLSTVVVYMTLGMLAEQSATPMKYLLEIATGSKLAFVIYPQAIINFVFLPQLWSVLFYLMLISLGLDCQFSLLETFLTSSYECFRCLSLHRMYFCITACCLCYLINLVGITQKGSQVIAMMDEASDGNTIMFIALCEILAVSRCYGTERMNQIIKFLTFYKPPRLFTLCWNYLIPFLLMLLLICCFTANLKTPYMDFDHYPAWIEFSFWMISCFIICQIPAWFLAALVYYALTGHIGKAFKSTADWFPAAAQDQDEFHQYTVSLSQLRAFKSSLVHYEKFKTKPTEFSLPKIKNLAADNNFFRVIASITSKSKRAQHKRDESNGQKNDKD